MRELEEYEMLEGEDYVFVFVSECTTETLARAADELAWAHHGTNSGEQPAALEWFRGQAEKCQLRRHTTELTGNEECGCESADWWCPFGDGEKSWCWRWDNSILSLLGDRVEEGAA